MPARPSPARRRAARRPSPRRRSRRRRPARRATRRTCPKGSALGPRAEERQSGRVELGAGGAAQAEGRARGRPGRPARGARTPAGAQRLSQRRREGQLRRREREGTHVSRREQVFLLDVHEPTLAKLDERVGAELVDRKLGQLVPEALRLVLDDELRRTAVLGAEGREVGEAVEREGERDRLVRGRDEGRCCMSKRQQAEVAERKVEEGTHGSGRQLCREGRGQCASGNERTRTGETH